MSLGPTINSEIESGTEQVAEKIHKTDYSLKASSQQFMSSTPATDKTDVEGEGSLTAGTDKPAKKTKAPAKKASSKPKAAAQSKTTAKAKAAAKSKAVTKPKKSAKTKAATGAKSGSGAAKPSGNKTKT